jgi:two-component system, sensor histidine kinase
LNKLASLSLRRWFGARLERQIAFSAALVTFIAATIFAAVATSATVWLLRAQQTELLHSRAAGVAHALGEQLARTVAEVGVLSANTLVSTALLDSAGRQLYLLPFLRSYQVRGIEPGALVLCDFNGETLASNAPSGGPEPQGCYRERAEFQQVFEREAPIAFLATGPGDTAIVLMQPVLYPNTGRAEGVLVARILPGQFLKAVERLSPDSHIELFRDHQPKRPSGVPRVELPLPLQGALAPLAIHVRLSQPLDLWHPVVSSLLAYTVVTILLLLIAVPLAITAGRRLARPLTELATAAQRVATLGAMTEIVPPTRSDEVGRLGDALAAMVIALRGAQAGLEGQVAERTRALRHALEAELAAEAALRESMELYESLVEVLPQFIYRMDNQGRLTFANQALAHRLGQSRQALMGKTLFDLYPAALAGQSRRRG